MLLKIIRLYTFYFPFDRGKWRFYTLAKKLYGKLPAKVLATTDDGRRLQVSLSDWMGDGIYFLGKYEVFCTEIVRRHINTGDVCLVVGANIGWYTTLFSKLVGNEGAVHAFEPVPETFDLLKENVALTAKEANVFINNFALGDEEKNLDIHVFENMPMGHSSLAAKPGQNSATVFVKVKTLDSYLLQRKIERVNFVKVDIEGAEMLFLRGAEKLFEQATPPVIFMEMALETTKEFGYFPNDLIVFLREKADYKFYALDEENEKLLEIDGFSADDIGANVLCVPQSRATDL